MASLFSSMPQGLSVSRESYRTRCRRWFYHARRALRDAVLEQQLRRYVGSAADITTYTPACERLCLMNEALAVLGRPEARGRFLEVGSYLGATAVVLAEALRRGNLREPGRLWCIDTWENDAMSEGRRDTFDLFSSHVGSWSDTIVPLRGGSHDVALPDAEGFDLIFIDGDHSYDAVCQDLARFAPLVLPHGRLVLHDHCSKPGVARALGELLAGGEWAIRCCTGSMISLMHASWSEGPQP